MTLVEMKYFLLIYHLEICFMCTILIRTINLLIWYTVILIMANERMEKGLRVSLNVFAIIVICNDCCANPYVV